MKRVCLVCTVLLLLPIAGRCQLWLNPGDSYTYEFRNFTLGSSAETNHGTKLYLGMSGADGGEGFLLEIFENSTSEAPLVTFPDIRFMPNPTLLGNAWQDRQGVVRFTITSGAVSVDILFATIVYPNGELYAEGFDILDTDRDGVVDHQDQCPNTAPGVIVDERGCGAAPPANTRYRGVRISGGSLAAKWQNGTGHNRNKGVGRVRCDGECADCCR
jgi:hypothetical protein